MKHTVVVEHHFFFRKKNTECNRGKDPNMNNGLNKLKQYWNEKPVETLLVLSAVAVSAAKLIDAVSAAQGRRAYSQQVQISKARQGL